PRDGFHDHPVVRRAAGLGAAWDRRDLRERRRQRTCRCDRHPARWRRRSLGDAGRATARDRDAQAAWVPFRHRAATAWTAGSLQVSAFPTSVRIREVGPRDGFQNEPEVIPTAEKVRLIELLGASGLRRIEVTSFVRADVIPQLADGAEVLAAVKLPDEVSVSVLIPNERGLDRALQQRQRFDEINGFLSASETHNQKNVGRSVAESLAGLERTF